MNPDDPNFIYDEFSMFGENAAEYGLSLEAFPPVSRVEWVVEDGLRVSGLKWGVEEPRIVLLHGGAQNAHTWDTVMLGLGVDALCIDLPGHGHSGHRSDGGYGPRSNAEAVCSVIQAVCSRPVVLVGMSLGGLTANAVAARIPALISRLVVIDVTPGVNADKAKAIHDFIAGPQTFASFTEIFDRTVAFNPTRTHESLRRGILHNALRLEDGSWAWRYDRRNLSDTAIAEMGNLWDDVSAVRCPYLLVRGGVSPVVDDDDVAELLRRRPTAAIVVVDGAGHSVQGDDPLRLVELLRHELSEA
jgi:pimeloyl-ACP methyl ester carboxylesterase